MYASTAAPSHVKKVRTTPVNSSMLLELNLFRLSARLGVRCNRQGNLLMLTYPRPTHHPLPFTSSPSHSPTPPPYPHPPPTRPPNHQSRPAPNKTQIGNRVKPLTQPRMCTTGTESVRTDQSDGWARFASSLHLNVTTTIVGLFSPTDGGMVFSWIESTHSLNCANPWPIFSSISARPNSMPEGHVRVPVLNNYEQKLKRNTS